MSNGVKIARALPAGAEVVEGGVHFRVWSPDRQSVQVVLVQETQPVAVHPLQREEGGYFSDLLPDVRPGQRYFLRVDNDPQDYPDPASNYQPQGVHGPSEVVDHRQFNWTDNAWTGATLRGQVIYEMHVGTWTPEGTWKGAAAKLPHLAELGVTLVEVMPVAEFQGTFGWGYDGVYWYAPTHLYGTPDDFRAFVNEAHRLGLGVILDVVYNHFGPSGNYTGVFSPYYISKRHPTEWGDAINFDGSQSAGVREFVTANAAYWMRNFHLDGLRIDASQAILDDSEEHILAAVGRTARHAAEGRSIVIFAEDEMQRAQHVEPLDRGGYGLDGLWNDDFHHTCRVAATGLAEYYYSDYAGTPQEIIAATKYGYLYQGQWNQRQKAKRGTPVWHLPAAHFVNALQNHDQVANSMHGWRGHRLTSPGRWRALTALLFLAPGTPLLFMGQEFGASAPFLYFADHEVELAELVRQGRWSFLREFPRTAGAADAAPLADPSARSTFEASKLDWSEAETHAATLALHRDLIRLRKQDPVFSQQDATMLHGSVIAPEALVLRWLTTDGDDRLLLLNLGRDLQWHPAAIPLLAPPPTREWKILWSSEEPYYGGAGTALLDMQELLIPGHAAIVLQATIGSGDSENR